MKVGSENISTQGTEYLESKYENRNAKGKMLNP